jgi:hypothetical protein
VEYGISPLAIREKFALRGCDTIQALQFFADEQLPPELRIIVEPLRVAAFTLVNRLKDGSQLTAALFKLVEAKDAFCRHYMITHNFKLVHYDA